MSPINDLPLGSSEHRYYEALAGLLQELELSISEQNGFACLWALEMSTIYLKDGSVFGADNTHFGTVADNCVVIAHLFRDINDKDSWWRARYPEYAGRDDVHEAAKKIIAEIAAKDVVSRVVTYLGLIPGSQDKIEFAGLRRNRT